METIFYANGNCDLEALDKNESEETIIDDLPRELKSKKIYQLLDEYFQDGIDMSEPWDELTGKIQNLYKDIDEELDLEFSYYVCCFVGKCKRLDIIPIKESFKDIVIKLIKYNKRGKQVNNEQLRLLENSLMYILQYIQGEDWVVIRNCVSCFENLDTVESILSSLLYEII